MLFSFLNVNPSTELRIRMKKSRTARMKKRRFRAIKEERMRVYLNSISMEESIKEMVLNMIDSASSFAECRRRVKPKRPIEEALSEEKEELPICRKKRRIVRTWFERSYAIFMLLHPKIFAGDANEASLTLGIARSTLLGWLSPTSKKKYVEKWFDIVANLTWGDVRSRYDEKVVEKFKDIDDNEKVNLSR